MFGGSISYTLYHHKYSFYDPTPPPNIIDKKTVIEHFGGKADEEIEASEKRIKILAEKASIKDIQIYYTRTLNDDAGAVIAYDINVMILSPAYVLSNETLSRKTSNKYPFKEYKDFVIGHELSHLSSKKEYYYRYFSPVLIIGVVYIGLFTRYWFTPLVYLFGERGLQRYFEKEADINGAKLTDSVDQGIEFFKYLQQHNLKHCTGWRKYLIGRNGDSYYDVDHPLTSRRIRYLSTIKK